MKETIAFIMAGGRGERLMPLTRDRTKPAVPFGGIYRLVDFTLSNCVNSRIYKIIVLPQYKSQTLQDHLVEGWNIFSHKIGHFLKVVPPQQRVGLDWYRGTADAIYQNLDIIRNHEPEYVLILAGDHIYKMDYGAMLAAHVEKQADVTVGCIEVPIEQAHAFGVMEVDSEDRVLEFQEKPSEPKAKIGRPDAALCSMGIYIFNKDFLFEQLIKDADSPNSSHDFGKDIIPDVINKYRVYAHDFLDPETNEQAYWRDVGTVDAFWEANLELIGVTPELNLYDNKWPIWTYQEQLPPAKFIFDDEERRGMAVDSMVSGGCIISGAQVRHSLLFSNVKVNSYTTLEDAVILPEAEIGRNCHIKRAVIDKGCHIPEGTVIGEDPEEDAKRFHVTPGGIALVVPEMLGQQLHHVR